MKTILVSSIICLVLGSTTIQASELTSIKVNPSIFTHTELLSAPDPEKPQDPRYINIDVTPGRLSTLTQLPITHPLNSPFLYARIASAILLQAKPDKSRQQLIRDICQDSILEKYPDMETRGLVKQVFIVPVGIVLHGPNMEDVLVTCEQDSGEFQFQMYQDTAVFPKPVEHAIYSVSLIIALSAMIFGILIAVMLTKRRKLLKAAGLTNDN